MAARSRYNSVPLGQAGTGAAYVLPESRALEGLIQNIEHNRKVGLLNIQARKDMQAQTNKDFLDNQLKAKSGILFQPEIDQLTSAWNQKGSEMRMKNFNPFNPNIDDPEQVKKSTEFLNEKARIERMAETRELYQKNFLDQKAAYDKGEVDEDSWKAFNDFYSNNKLSDLMSAGIAPPTTTKPFDHTDFMKNVSDATVEYNTIKDGVETTVKQANPDKIRFSIENQMANNPKAERFYMKRFGVDMNQVPVKMLVRSTDPKEVSTFLDEYYKTDPEGIKEAAKVFPSGTVPSYNSPDYQKFVAEQSRKQLDAEIKYDRGLDKLTEEKAAGIDGSKKVGFNYEQENQQMRREDQAMQRRAEARSVEELKLKRADRADKNAEKEEKYAATEQRDKFIQGVQVGNKKQMSDLRQILKSKGGKVSYTKDGLLRLTWDKEVNGESTTVTQDVDLSKKNDEGYAHLNEVLSSVTGKDIDLESLRGKKNYSGALFETPKRSFNKPEMEFIRNSFNTIESMGDFLKMRGYYKTSKEAYKAAAELLDPKGREHEVVFKKK